MLDIKFVRENLKLVQKSSQDKGVDVDISHILEIDREFQKLSSEVQKLREERNKLAKERNIEAGKELKNKLDKEEQALRAVEEELKLNLLKIPNIPLSHLPIGNEAANKVIKKVGKPKKFDFLVKDHLEIGERLDIIDTTRASKVSGTRFAYLKNEGALLELALLQFTFEKLVKKGFIPTFPPALIRQEITNGLGYWQAGGNENYYLVTDYEEMEVSGNHKVNPLYLIGTAEHAIVPMHKDEVFSKSDLPKRYVGFSSSFRREAGSYGKDTRGILRVHQFDKIEMVAFVKSEDDETERRKLLEIAESFMADLGLPYQVVQLATGDISFPSAETIDIETWIPSQGKYRETHSIATTTDFQARRLNIKYQDGTENKYVHILNGTAFAIGRTIVAILENYQQADGSVEVPKILQKYIGKSVIKVNK
ncbi:MAG: serine--tRNA ligase [Candidatus Levybacteria bacterium]|nr:serine--tRNA ligase [Candidatus Levybacteria bacterium]